MPLELIWLVPATPAAAAIIVMLFFRPFAKHESRSPAVVTVPAVAVAFGLSIWYLSDMIIAGNLSPRIWNAAGLSYDPLHFNMNLILEPLTVIMLVAVTFVSLMVQMYSLGYIHRHPENSGKNSLSTYFGWVSLLTAAMLGLILSGNLLLMFVFWELIGLCSYSLIGYWFTDDNSLKSAKKTFIVTRLGDLGFLSAILLLFWSTGTFDTGSIREMVGTEALSGGVVIWAVVGIFAGAMAKSAQFPFHIWAPDASRAPLPASALIFSTTMVAAGAFLVARTFFLFEASPAMLSTIAIIGGITALLAATVAMISNDIRRVLAYSTISQLGFTMMGFGVGGVVIGLFHLFKHSFFKSLLFLSAGNIERTTGQSDVQNMAGIGKTLPWTQFTFIIGALCLAGIWPLAGFWSKDEILIASLYNQPLLFILSLLVIFATSFYIFRVVFLITNRYRQDKEDIKPLLIRESPPIMVLPLILLALAAVAAGFWNATGEFGAFLGQGQPKSFVDAFFKVFTRNWLPVVSQLIALSGIFMAYILYGARWLHPETMVRGILKPLYGILNKNYYLDGLYQKLFAGKNQPERKNPSSWLYGLYSLVILLLVAGFLWLFG